MKYFLITLIALFTLTVNAQKKEKGQRQNKNNFTWNKKYMAEIGLSAEQQAKIESIKSASNSEMLPIKSDSTLAEDLRKTRLAEMQKKRLAAIDALLTDEQKKKVEEIKARLKKENEGDNK